MKDKIKYTVEDYLDLQVESAEMLLVFNIYYDLLTLLVTDILKDCNCKK